MKKEILEKFASFKMSRNLSKEIKGGYNADGECNRIGCPTSGGSCSNIGTCHIGAQKYALYSCSQPYNPQPKIDSLNKTPGGSGGYIFSNTTYVTCTGEPIA